MDERIEPLLSYLKEHFGEVDVDETPLGVVFRMRSGCTLTVVHELIDGDLRAFAERSRVAEELRQSEGLPMVLSEEGVRLASSN